MLLRPDRPAPPAAHVLRDHGGAASRRTWSTISGLTFAVGLAPTKVVAKLASKWQKPAGLTIIRGTDLHVYLDQVPIENVWGIGPQTTAYLTRFGITTALDFARQDELWVRSKLTKPHQDIWHELRGTAVIPLEFGEHHAYQSISKTKTFTPPTSDRDHAPGAALEKRGKRLHQGQEAQIGSPARELFSAHAGFSAYGV